MKTEELKAQGLTDEQIAFVMSENGKDINREKERAEGYKSQLDNAKSALKAFEGVDVAELKNKIATLTNDLTAQAESHKQQLAERDFNDLIKQYAGQYKARNLQTVLPLLDIEKLKQSQNQNDDIKSAFEAVKKDNGYLFEDNNVPRVVSITSGPNSATNDITTKANDALRSIFGKE